MTSVTKQARQRAKNHKIVLVKLPYVTMRGHHTEDKVTLRNLGKRLQYGAMYGAGPQTLMSMSHVHNVELFLGGMK